MDKKKLDSWAAQLLDTGKRNNLISFKDTKTSTAEVVIPEALELFDRIDRFDKDDKGILFEVFDPKIADIEDTDVAEEDDQQLLLSDGAHTAPASGKEMYIQQYQSRIRKQQILLYAPNGANPISALKNIDKRAKEYIDETGVNVAYLAFGFVHWKESENSAEFHRAPLLLIPVELHQESAIHPYTAHLTADEIILNPTFSYKISSEYGIKLPEYTPDEGLSAYLDSIGDIVKKLQWSVSRECKIGIFSFLKINMYRDLKDNSDQILKNENVRLLLGESSGREYDGGTFGAEEAHTKNPLIDLHNVVDADSSQIEAIEMTKSGQSFVLQGPPGTGKSQTITNIIAECLSDGKRILFVSEKLAALNVVYDKLKKAGLDEFCLELHSHKASKKDVISELCKTLHAEKKNVSARADDEVAKKEKYQHQLDAYEAALHLVRPVIEKSLYQLYEAYSQYRQTRSIEWSVPDISTKGAAYLDETAELLERFVQYLPSVGYNYKRNPWYGYVNQDVSYQAKNDVKNVLVNTSQFLENLNPIMDEIFEKYDVVCGKCSDAELWARFFGLAKTSDFLSPSLLCPDNLSQISKILPDLKSLSADILSARSWIDAAYDAEIYQIDGAETNKQLVRQFGGAFSRLFNQEYKKLISAIRLCKKDGKKPSYEDAVSLTEKLSLYQQKTREFSGLEAPAKECFGKAYCGITTDWSAATSEVVTLYELVKSLGSFGRLAGMAPAEYEAEKAEFAGLADRLTAAFAKGRDEFVSACQFFSPEVFDLGMVSGKLALAKCKDCSAAIDQVDNWCRFRDVLHRLEKVQALSFADDAIASNIESSEIVNCFKKKFIYQWIDYILFSDPALAQFSRIAQDQAVQAFAQKDIQQFEISKAKIRAELSSKRPSLDMIAGGSAVSILLREGEKKRKQKSIRTLLSETGELVQVIKPCFLMSPLSVSTFLAPDAVHFDVVVFDEASQIFPQDAIGAIYRADQMIVVGDSRQMPPSNFFNAALDVATDDEDSGDVTDFESILDLCATTMRQLRLCWHYRSRYEQLITFSNKNFYGNELVTFPSAKTDSVGVGVDYYHVDGVFDRTSHTNRKEAEYVVDLIFKNLEDHPERSLGVVAFSVAQQNLIDKLLMKRRQEAPEKEYLFVRDTNEPFFIKNLETVQGDERDTIIFSIAYGKDVQGKLLHNFGPLNRVGGERRLNVAVTRAKCNVQLVSSMHYTDIDLARTSAEGARLLREYLDYAENGNIALERTVSVNPFDQFDSDFELEVCEFLRANGFTVDTQVGCSGFRIDLGLKHPDGTDYALAIECDGATYHSSRNARDRDRLRQEVLERMGWKFYRIWSTDWFRNKAVEQQRLLEAANDALNAAPPIIEKTAGEEPDAEQFEEPAIAENFAFPEYEEANTGILKTYSASQFQHGLISVLEKEAPLSEEYLLKRISPLFGREKVTSVVQQAYNSLMYGCTSNGILRRNGFLYLLSQNEIHFRAPGATPREVKYISVEELSDGMYEILKHNISADKSGLFHSLALQCGVTRVGKAINEYFENALDHLLAKDLVVVTDNQVSLKN